jgi:micrococcal nuclease
MLCPSSNKAQAGAIRVKALIVLSTLLCLITGQVYAASFTGKLVKVLDGDTVEVMHEGKAERIRLAQIDCPEKNQPFGQAAKRYVLDIAAQKIVTVQVDTVDRYGRTVGEVFLPDGSNLNKQIVGAGYAWQYKRYSKDPAYANHEQEARAAKRGLWQDKAPIPPWKWRKGQRQVSSVQVTDKDFTCGSKRYCNRHTMSLLLATGSHVTGSKQNRWSSGVSSRHL